MYTHGWGVNVMYTKVECTCDVHMGWGVHVMYTWGGV